MNNAKPWRDYQGKTDGAGKCINTAQPLTTIESEFKNGY